MNQVKSTECSLLSNGPSFSIEELMRAINEFSDLHGISSYKGSFSSSYTKNWWWMLFHGFLVIIIFSEFSLAKIFERIIFLYVGPNDHNPCQASVTLTCSVSEQEPIVLFSWAPSSLKIFAGDDPSFVKTDHTDGLINVKCVHLSNSHYQSC